jgi:UDP-N-acetylglucosamine 4,6-dehydratase
MFSKKTILVTGGTGSFGQAFVSYILNNYSNIKKIIIFSRDELKQFEMKNLLKKNKNFYKLRFFLGDIRDKDRLLRAFNGVDIIIHAAALKQVDTAEYNPLEFIKTNIIGASNIIEASLDSNVSQVVALSTDKASSPINLYGATKLCSDKLFLAANNYAGSDRIKFSVVRYGNVFGSRGSVVPFFFKKKKENIIPITSEDMTRFNITLDKAIKLVIQVIKNQVGSEILVPKLSSLKIMDLANVIAPGIKKKIIGIRPGEKIHEELMSEYESLNSLEFKDMFLIMSNKEIINFYKKYGKFKVIKNCFSYNSGNNKYFLNKNEILSLLKKYFINDFA